MHQNKYRKKLDQHNQIQNQSMLMIYRLLAKHRLIIQEPCFNEEVDMTKDMNILDAQIEKIVGVQ